tara:strand:+ start:14484 stop:14663 length:180 start_codon:yes stop_codon:yes gene_type:complete
MTSILSENGEIFNSSALLRSDHIATTPNLTSLPIPATHWDDFNLKTPNMTNIEARMSSM